MFARVPPRANNLPHSSYSSYCDNNSASLFTSAKNKKELLFSRFFCLVSFSWVSYANMRKKMKEVVHYYFTAWFSFSQVCNFASVVSTSETGLTALAVPASETMLIQRIMRRRLKERRTKR